jgi:hypothetical protein
MRTPRPISFRLRTLFALSAVCLGGILAACGDAATGTEPTPSAQPSRAAAPSPTINTSPVLVSTLTRKNPLAKDITASVTLYNTGGTLDVPEAGLHVAIPRNALPASDRPITITVTALKGSQVAYEFGPSGTKFKASLNVTQDLTNTTWAGNTGNTTLQADYFKSVSDLDPATGTAFSYESIPVTVQATGNRLHWDIWHFSGYIVSWGRK